MPLPLPRDFAARILPSVIVPSGDVKVRFPTNPTGLIGNCPGAGFPRNPTGLIGNGSPRDGCGCKYHGCNSLRCGWVACAVSRITSESLQTAAGGGCPTPRVPGGPVECQGRRGSHRAPEREACLTCPRSRPLAAWPRGRYLIVTIQRAAATCGSWPRRARLWLYGTRGRNGVDPHRGPRASTPE